MTWYGSNNETYIAGRELGRGGEGCVYELTGHTSQVLKIYNEPPDSKLYEKLQLMTSMRTPALEAFAAWPADVVKDEAGVPAGFIMKKLTGYTALHHAFSPMDRKRLFPDKGYNFLVHVARNVATAFHRIHEAGIIAGDVNEGNLLVNTAGMVAFIDCDSFQIKDGDNYYYCEVGVPRYTPPEMLRRKSFDKVIRTEHTDNFSLAVLLFQLLFLGRHPYAGRNLTSGDMDEETAIRLGHFAYSLHKERKKLEPPKDSFALTNLPEDLVNLFHKAFETEERPKPAEWIKALDAMLANMQTCVNSQLHTYPGTLAACPWCTFRKERGIMFFLDDSYTQANATLGNIEHFINGFRPERPTLEKWEYKEAMPHLVPEPLPPILQNAHKWRMTITVATALAGVVMLLYYTPVGILLLPGAMLVYRHAWRKAEKRERKSRKEALTLATNRYYGMLRMYEHPAEMESYERQLNQLLQLIAQFRQLPDEYKKRVREQEELLYQDQLDDYLRQYDIEEHSIPSISTARKAALQQSGIWNAAHISKLANIKVPGIGPVYEQKLYAWRRQMASGFVYIPDNYKMGLARQKATEEVNKIKHQLEQQIRAAYQSLNFLKMSINNKLTMMRPQLKELYLKMKQAETNASA